MGRFLTASGEDTSDESLAAKGPTRAGRERPPQPLGDQDRTTTALNTSFFAERVAIFSIVMGIAMLLTGIGFFVLTVGGALGPAVAPSRSEQLSTASAAT